MVYQMTDNIYALGKTIIKPEKEFSFTAYLIKGEKNILIDTLPERSAEMLMEELTKILDGEGLDVLILNHGELDHAGAVPTVLAAYPNVAIYCTKECQGNLAEHLDASSCNFVASGDQLTFGNLTFQFITTPGLHWNDNMVTFLKEEKILFSNDFYGQFSAAEPPLDEDYGDDKFMAGLDGYYQKVFANAHKEQRTNALKVLDLPVSMVAPGHGLLIKKMLQPTLDYYRTELSR